MDEFSTLCYSEFQIHTFIFGLQATIKQFN